jgi:hypothetical protein
MRGRQTMRSRTILGAVAALPVLASRHAAGAGTGGGITDELMKAAHQGCRGPTPRGRAGLVW